MPVDANHCSVLLVDDDPDILEVLVEVLAARGYRVDCATNGREALAHLRSGPPPGIILLDLMMPVMDGWQFCAERQKDPRLAAIPVVVVSATNRLDESTRSIGVVGSIAKPFLVEDLIKIVDRHCLA